MRDISELLIFLPEEDDEKKLLEDMSFLMGIYGQDSDRSLRDAARDRVILSDCMRRMIKLSLDRGFYGNLWHDVLTLILVKSENAYSRDAELAGTPAGSVYELALHDMKIFGDLYDFRLNLFENIPGSEELHLLIDYQTEKKEKSPVFNVRIRDRICHLADEIGRGADAEEKLETLTLFYNEYGAGRFGLHKAFRVEEKGNTAEIVPIKNIKHVKFSDLVGYERAKEALKENTIAFLNGKPANNCLLYGDAGTGKSSCIKALANEYFTSGLRIIEIYSHQFRLLNSVIEEVKSKNYRFIIYMDDLSFEEFETQYKYLKAVIEGGLEKKPDNVLIYATSNRRHLIRESFNDKKSLSDDDIHRNDTVQEKLSLSARFGVTIYFGSPEPTEYDDIVSALADRQGISMDKDMLREKARAWAMRHGGLSGRTAQQYIDHLSGKEDHL